MFSFNVVAVVSNRFHSKVLLNEMCLYSYIANRLLSLILDNRVIGFTEFFFFFDLFLRVFFLQFIFKKPNRAKAIKCLKHTVPSTTV